MLYPYELGQKNINNLIFVALSTFSEKDNGPLNLLKSSGIKYKIHNSGKRITKQELLDDALDATIIIAGVEIYDKELLNDMNSESIEKKFNC
mgnify:CR=1 FL=1